MRTVFGMGAFVLFSLIGCNGATSPQTVSEQIAIAKAQQENGQAVKIDNAVVTYIQDQDEKSATEWYFCTI